jgi:hypothetical protein
MVKRFTLAGAFVLLAQAGISGCGGTEDPPAEETGGTGGTSAGATGGTGGSTTAGTGGSSGTAAGCIVAGEATPPPPPPPGCSGIKTGAACVTEAQVCEPLACGIADSGRRSCTCTGGVWDCPLCDFAGTPFETVPACLAATACTGAEVDKVTCTTQGSICQGAEVCVCWPDAEGALIWDCDAPPSVW